MKKAIFKSLLLLALVSLLSVGAAAADKPAFLFALSADGETELSVSTGDVITVTLELHRTDRQQDYTMYAMQDEIRYDKTFFRLVTDSDQPASGVQTRDIALRDHHRAHYLNFVSLSGGRSNADSLPQPSKQPGNSVTPVFLSHTRTRSKDVQFSKAAV